MTNTDGWIDAGFEGTFKHFPNPGDGIIGIVEDFDPEAGVQNFNRDGEVGCLRLATADGPVLVALNGPSLQRAVRQAMRRAEQMGLWGPRAKLYDLVVFVKFTTWAGEGSRRYKVYKALIRRAREADRLEMMPLVAPVDETTEAPF